MVKRAKFDLGGPREKAPPAVPPASTADSAVKVERPGRVGTKFIGGHFPKATWIRLGSLCRKNDKTQQEILDEALADIFVKYGEP